MTCQMNLISRLKVFCIPTKLLGRTFLFLQNLKTILFAHNIYSSRYFRYFVCLLFSKAAVGRYSKNLGYWRLTKHFFQETSSDKMDRWDSTCFKQTLQPSIYRLLIFLTLIQILSMILTSQGCLFSYRKVYGALSLLFRIGVRGGEGQWWEEKIKIRRHEYNIWRYLWYL